MNIHSTHEKQSRPGEAPETVIEVTDLWRWYRDSWGRKSSALRGVDLRVRAGEVTGLLGPNGAGKTTTLKTILGMLRPSRGSVRVFGRDVSDPASRRRLGFLTEQPYYYDYLTAREFLDLCGVLCGLEREQRHRRAEALLEQVGLTASADTRLRKYSKGMLQRLGLAQALVHEPSLVILDEPMSGLDPLGRKLVRDVILGLRQAGTTVLFSSHILPDVETLCDSVAILAQGRVAASGTVADLSSETDPGFEIVAQNVNPPLYGAFVTRGLEVRNTGRRVIIQAPDREHMNLIVGELLGSGAGLIGVAPRRSPLEAKFLSTVAAPETAASKPAPKLERVEGRSAGATPDEHTLERTGTDQ